MLTNTFVHIPGVGAITEQRLWEAGFQDWDRFLQSPGVNGSLKKSERIRRHLEESREYLQNEDPCYFSDRLPARFQWRFFPEFRDRTVYLDIETTGMDGYDTDITLIGLFDGNAITYFIKDQNLEAFAEEIQKYRVIVTYNGRCFDVPFIRSRLGVPMDHAHIDLRYVLAGLGYRGGLKGCERAVGIDRGVLAGLDGFDAVLLWHDFYHNGNRKALDTLLAYNGQDIVNLETLMVLAYNQNLRQTPFFHENRLPAPSIRAIPYDADPETVQRIQFSKAWSFNQNLYR